jgi:glutamate synthase domain-containing protein 1
MTPSHDPRAHDKGDQGVARAFLLCERGAGAVDAGKGDGIVNGESDVYLRALASAAETWLREAKALGRTRVLADIARQEALRQCAYHVQSILRQRELRQEADWLHWRG